MAGAATSFSSPLSHLHFRKLTSPPSNLHFLHSSFHFSLSSQKPTCIQIPKTHIHHGKMNVGFGEVIEEIEAAFSEEEIDEEDEEEEESSIDLLFKFLHNVFRKISKRAKKATRSVLPPAISPQLVSFAVDGVLLLTALSVAKALLEVVCTLGGTVFVVILLLRLIWATVSHFQSSGNSLDHGGAYNTTQPTS
ncbi:uncharacterized protein LOC143845986 [Tasmannia lanceolata]|uniref:uncharacterized protein LOC143845986 n=1 Tax=Tasmannia lanceolata TaxID=3420 RepID=UPI00406339FD